MPELSLFSGPVGGIVAFGFMSGVGVGWVACQKYAVAIYKDQITDYKERVAKLEKAVGLE